MIIGIHGKKGSGKTTLATMLHTQLPHFEIKSFASPVYSIVSILTGKPIEYLKDNKQEIIMGLTIRQWLQKIGTDWLRKEIDSDIWVKILMRDYAPESNWILDDVRFENEAESISDCNHILIKITGHGEDDTHASEHGLGNWNQWDFIIDNSGDIDNLSSQCNTILNRLRYMTDYPCWDIRH